MCSLAFFAKKRREKSVGITSLVFGNGSYLNPGIGIGFCDRITAADGDLRHLLSGPASETARPDELNSGQHGGQRVLAFNPTP